MPFTEDTTGVDVHVARPRYLGLTPRALVVAIAALALVLGLVGLATGDVAAGVLLLVAAAFLAALYLEQAKRRRESSLDHAAVLAAAHARSLARIVRLRVEASLRARERAGLLSALGEACYAGDETQIENLREQIRVLDDEGHAAAETQVMGDPGFEPGTSALSERRSNQLS